MHAAAVTITPTRGLRRFHRRLTDSPQPSSALELRPPCVLELMPCGLPRGRRMAGSHRLFSCVHQGSRGAPATTDSASTAPSRKEVLDGDVPRSVAENRLRDLTAPDVRTRSIRGLPRRTGKDLESKEVSTVNRARILLVVAAAILCVAASRVPRAKTECSAAPMPTGTTIAVGHTDAASTGAKPRSTQPTLPISPGNGAR